MPGKVPISGYKMFDDPNSIHQAVIDRYGGPLYAEFDTILSKTRAEGDIDDFDPSYRPASGNLNDVNSSDHFRGFPATKYVLLGHEGNTLTEACQNGNVVFWTGDYTGTLSVGKNLTVSVNGSQGYFKIVSAEDASLNGRVVLIDDNGDIQSISSAPCSVSIGIYHYCDVNNLIYYT